MLKITKNDPYLQPYDGALQARHDYAERREKELTQGQSLSDWATGYLYFGLHYVPAPKKKGRQPKTPQYQWVLREWAPNATAIYLKGDFNNWEKREDWRLQPVGNGVWEGIWPGDWLKHGEHFKLLVEWNGGWGERIPSYANRVVQDEETKIFAAQVWHPEVTEKVKHTSWKGLKKDEELYIYECHIGMSGEQERVATYEEFRRDILPRVADLGLRSEQPLRYARRVARTHRRCTQSRNRSHHGYRSLARREERVGRLG